MKKLYTNQTLTKTNPIVKFNNPVYHHYKKRRKKTQYAIVTGSIVRIRNSEATPRQLESVPEMENNRPP